MRIENHSVDELIDNGGELKVGPMNQIGVLRLALDLRDARQELEKARELLKTLMRTGDALARVAQSGEAWNSWARETNPLRNGR
jgi:hypothetical protein